MDRRNWMQFASLGASAFLLSPLMGETIPTHYHLDFQPKGWIKLGGNENPYGPFPESRRMMKEYMKTANRYPTLKKELIQEIAQKVNVEPEYIMLGAGSSEILGLATLLFLQKGGELVTATPTFRIWMNMARALGATVNSIPLDAEKKHDLKKMEGAVKANTRMLYVCNPNNPSGTELDPKQLIPFIEKMAARTPVLIDEVYQDFSIHPSLAKLTHDNRNIVVSRSFSKIYGLAGMRIGYGVAHPDTIKKLQSLQPWSGVSVTQLSLAAALGALRDTKTFEMSMQKNKESLQLTMDYLDSKSIRYIPSSINMLYFSLDKVPEDYIDRMNAHKMIVREIKETDGRWSRVSMGKPEEMALFCKYLDSMIL